MTNPLLEQALAYARAGKPIFPCLANSKDPATPHGFHDATTDETTIRAWWQEDPAYNVALCPDDCGWLVVDLDKDKKTGDHTGEETWAKLLEEHGEAPTYEVVTPSGGRHLYYAGSGRSSVRKALGPGVDTRGVGGYILIPPSVINGRPYKVFANDPITELPAWVSEKLTTSLSFSSVVMPS